MIAPGVVETAGLSGSFPLWPGPDRADALALDNARARSHGLVLRPLEESIDEVLEWWGERPWPDHWLKPEVEATLLD